MSSPAARRLRNARRLCALLLTLAVTALLAGQCYADASSQHQETAIKASGDMEDVDSSIEKACIDVSLIEEEREAFKAKLVDTEERLRVLQEQADALKLEHASELGSCDVDKKSLKDEIDSARGKAGELAGMLEEVGGDEGLKALAAKAAKAEETYRQNEEATRLAAEKHALLERKLEEAQTEADALRGKLSGAEERELKAREEAGKHANDKESVRRKLERTESELEIAKKPRKASVSAILTDVKSLSDDLMRQSADARDDLMAQGSFRFEQAREASMPYVEAARDTVQPSWDKVMDATAPQRAQANEFFAENAAKLDEAVGTPAAQKWLQVRAQVSKAADQAKVKWEDAEDAIMASLIKAGASREGAEKACKYMYLVLLAFASLVFLIYLAKPLLTWVVMPVVRSAVRWAFWLVLLPIRIFLLWPIKLIVRTFVGCYRLCFGPRKGRPSPSGAGKKGSKKPKTGAKSRR